MGQKIKAGDGEPPNYLCLTGVDSLVPLETRIGFFGNVTNPDNGATLEWTMRISVRKRSLG